MPPAHADAAPSRAPLLIAVDCATRPASLALLRGELTVAEASQQQADGARTDAWLGVALDMLLRGEAAEGDAVDGLAVTVGPGTFTGIRVGIATCLGLAAPRRLPVCGVPTLEAIAEAWRGTAPVVASCIDARRGQVYAALYRPDPARRFPHPPLWGPAVCLPEIFAAALRARDERSRTWRSTSSCDGAELLVAGSGAPLIRAASGPREGTRYSDEPRPLAAAAGRLAARPWPEAGDPPAWPPAEPLYLRPPDATPPVSPLARSR